MRSSPTKLRRTNLRSVLYTPKFKCYIRDTRNCRCLTGYPTRMTEHRRKNFFDFFREDSGEFGDLTAQSVDDIALRDWSNDTPTETSNSENQEERKVTEFTPVSPSADNVDPQEIQNERRRRIANAQDEELRWVNLKTVLRCDESTLTYQAARDALKIADRFVLSEDNVLYHLGTRLLSGDHLQKEPTLHLVVPTTMIQEQGMYALFPTAAGVKAGRSFAGTHLAERPF
ncbi:hypothetical protein PHMEG_00014299 [Phytophthora megakarya]|uniref:Reverse transcriptase n=1 Tax=Phytophthora megakarya TaxID=4795 RepID=A0A225W5T7_9STRA|nr:hypothetical protein PHMEG_00014299 [Phytophthora megakarya]